MGGSRESDGEGCTAREASAENAERGAHHREHLRKCFLGSTSSTHVSSAKRDASLRDFPSLTIEVSPKIGKLASRPAET